MFHFLWYNSFYWENRLILSCSVMYYLLRGELGLTWWLSGKESACQCRRCRRCGFNTRVRKIPWRRKWQPTPIFLPGKSLQRGAWQATVHGVAESDMSDWATELHTQGVKIGATEKQQVTSLMRDLDEFRKWLGKMSWQKYSAIRIAYERLGAGRKEP